MSNKLTFSLFFVLMLALLAGPALTQTMRLGSENERHVRDTVTLTRASVSLGIVTLSTAKGTTHLYITIPMDNNNKWMPEKDFLLVLRTENKDNHEKIVDIAGNKFIC